MPCKAWTGCCLFIKESCHTVASLFDSRGCFLVQYLWVNENVCIPMSQWKSHCFSAACPLWLFQVSSRQPKLNLLQSLAKPSKAWTGCYELICCKASLRSVLEETNCLAKHGRAWAGDVLSSKNHVPLLSRLWFLLSFFAVWWHLFLLYSDDIQAQIQVVDLATCELLAEMTEQFASSNYSLWAKPDPLCGAWTRHHKTIRLLQPVRFQIFIWPVWLSEQIVPLQVYDHWTHGVSLRWTKLRRAIVRT